MGIRQDAKDAAQRIVGAVCRRQLQWMVNVGVLVED